jgi:hypothetical protein
MSKQYWHHKSHSNSGPSHPKSSSINIKWSIIWILIHSFSVWFVSYFLVVITNEILYVLLAGLGITIIAKIMRTVTRHAPFRLDKQFVFWYCITTVSFLLVRLMLQFIQISSGIWYYLLMGCGIFIIGQIARRIR